MACTTACRTDRSSAYLLVPSARQWLDQRFLGRIARRLPSSFLPLVSSPPDGLLVGLLPRSFRSSMACWTACRVDRSSASFLVPSARQWLARRLAGYITLRLPSLFLSLVSGLSDGSPDRSLIGLLPCSFRSSVAFVTAPRTDCSSAYFLVSSAHQWLSRQLRGRIAHRLTSSSFRLSMTCRTDRSSANFLFSSTRQSLAGRIAHRLTSSFLPLVSGLPDGLPGGSLFGFLPRSFRLSVACPMARRTDRSSAYFLVPSAHQWLSQRLLRPIAHRLTSLFLPLISGFPDSSADGLLIGLLPRPSAHQ